MSEHFFPTARMSNIYLIPLPPPFFKHSQKLDNERSKSELNLRTCSYHGGEEGDICRLKVKEVFHNISN